MNLTLILFFIATLRFVTTLILYFFCLKRTNKEHIPKPHSFISLPLKSSFSFKGLFIAFTYTRLNDLTMVVHYNNDIMEYVRTLLPNIPWSSFFRFSNSPRPGFPSPYVPRKTLYNQDTIDHITDNDYTSVTDVKVNIANYIHNTNNHIISDNILTFSNILHNNLPLFVGFLAIVLYTFLPKLIKTFNNVYFMEKLLVVVSIPLSMYMFSYITIDFFKTFSDINMYILNIFKDTYIKTGSILAISKGIISYVHDENNFLNIKKLYSNTAYKCKSILSNSTKYLNSLYNNSILSNLNIDTTTRVNLITTITRDTIQQRSDQFVRSILETRRNVIVDNTTLAQRYENIDRNLRTIVNNRLVAFNTLNDLEVNSTIINNTLTQLLNLGAVLNNPNDLSTLNLSTIHPGYHDQVFNLSNTLIFAVDVMNDYWNTLARVLGQNRAIFEQSFSSSTVIDGEDLLMEIFRQTTGNRYMSWQQFRHNLNEYKESYRRQ